MGDAFLAARAGDHRVAAHGDAPLLAFGAPRLRRLRTGVDDGVDPNPGVVQVDRRGVGAVVRGEYHHLFADLDSVPVQVGARRSGQHDAGTVVVAEDDWAFMGAGGDHDVAGPYPPDPLAAQRGGRVAAEVVGAALERQHESVVVVAERRGALQVQHIGIAGQFAHRGRHPVEGRRAVDGVGAAKQRATGFALFVDDDHACTGACRGQCRGEARGANSNDKDIGVHVLGVVLRGVRDLGEPALPGNAAGGQPVEQLDGGRQQHRLGEGRLQLHESAGVFGPRSGNPARTTEFDAGGDLMNPVGQQCRCQRITGVAGEFAPTEGEVVGDVAIDAAARDGAEGCSHEMARLLFVEAVHAVESVRGGITNGVEPAPASGVVAPSFGEQPLGVGPEKYEVRPLLVGQRLRIGRIGDVRLAAVVELGLFARPAPWAFDQLHGDSSSVSGRRRPRRVRRPARR